MQRINKRNANKSKSATVRLMKFLLMVMILVSSLGLAETVFGAEEQSIPKQQSPLQDYPWYGYDSYKGNLLRYHDLKINLNGSKIYQVYCFNLKKREPLREGSSNPNWYKKWDGNAENFKTFADNPRGVGEELNANILRVLYNGYPNDANGIMKDLEPLNAILVTQNAIWYYSDNMLIFNADDFFTSEAKDLNIQAPQLKLMREALKKLINPYSAGAEFRQVPSNFKLNIFESHDKTFQNLLSAEYVPDTPPKPGEEPPTKTEKTSVIIRKYAEGDYSKLLEGATLRLTGEDIPDFQEKVFQSNGTGEKIELSNGTYTLTETSSPDGYEIAEPIKFRVENKKVFIVQKDGSRIENTNRETGTPYSVEAYDDRTNEELLSYGSPYGKFYYAKNRDGSKQVVYCFNANLKAPPESYDSGSEIAPDISEMRAIKYTHIAGTDLHKYSQKPRESNPETFLKKIKKVIEKGYGYAGNKNFETLTETQYRAATQLAIYYYTDSAELTKDWLQKYDDGKGYHGFQSMDESTLAATQFLVNYANNTQEPTISELDFFVPNSNRYQSLIGTSYYPDDLVDVIRMEDKKQEVIPVTHSLTVQKTVVGELGDKTKGFQFELELKDKTGQPIVDALKTNNQDLVAKDGKYSFNLKHGETIRIEGLPTGYSYTLKETEAKDYIVTVDNKVSQEAQSVGKDITEDKKVAFENRKDLVPPTGLTTDGAIYLWLLLLVPFGLLVWLFGRKGLKND